MFELQVTVSNEDFRGRTQVYSPFDSLSTFARSLIDYPNGNRVLFYEDGISDSYAFFSMRYYPVGKRGLVGVEVMIESNVPTEFRVEEKSKLKLELIVEPSAIDNFRQALLSMSARQEGAAVLYSNYADSFCP